MIRYVAVRPNGSICGPIGEDREFVKKSLIIGYKRTAANESINEEAMWEKITATGYTISRASIVLIDDNDDMLTTCPRGD